MGLARAAESFVVQVMSKWCLGKDEIVTSTKSSWRKSLQGEREREELTSGLKAKKLKKKIFSV